LVTIKRRTYIFESGEAGCANGAARIIDVTDDHHPVAVSYMALEVQVDPTCIAEWPANPLGIYWTHYFGFDSTDDSTNSHDPHNVHLAFLTAWGSGLRVINVCDPMHPREMGYYNPPAPGPSLPNSFVGPSRAHDTTLTWVRYIPKTRDLWFGSSINGFNIVHLESSVPKC
jgi:hypothetical protein